MPRAGGPPGVSQPHVARLAALVLVFVCLAGGQAHALPSAQPGGPAGQEAVNVPTFHGDRQRLGWNARETALTPASVASPAFGELWSSPVFDSLDLDGVSYAPHLYASPLYVDDVLLTGGDFAGHTVSVVVAATSNGYVYAVAAGSADVAPGTVAWRRQLGTAAVVPHLDGGVPMGILSTPIIDPDARPARLYVVAAHAVPGL